MEYIGRLLNAIMVGMQHEFVIYGHTISLWQIFIFTICAGILTAFVGGILSGD